MPDLADYERTRAAVPNKLPQGLDATAHSVAGCFRRRLSLSALRVEAEEIQKISLSLRELGDGDLASEMRELRMIFRRRGPECEALEPRALAFCVEAARRKVQGLLSAKSDREIIFTRNATEAINLVAMSWGQTLAQASKCSRASAIAPASNASRPKR